jgi:hypothetical protein
LLPSWCCAAHGRHALNAHGRHALDDSFRARLHSYFFDCCCQTRSVHWMSCCHAAFAQGSHSNVRLLGVLKPLDPYLLRPASRYHGESMRHRLPLIHPHWTFGPSLGEVSADSLFSWGCLASSESFEAVRQRLERLPPTGRLPL